MQTSKAILLILVLVTAAATIGVSICGSVGVPMYAREAALAAAIGLIAGITGLLPIQLRTDRSGVAMFQAAWIGSILHMGIAAALGIALLYVLKLSTPFVIWLLVMYWITLIALCVAFVKTLRTSESGQSGPTQQVTFG